ncbi:MAG: AraC family transcriptional regulator [Massilibacteroides sp.]|nr:AraC family transcriptional regulator [Massilibacteroides sp.]MDD4114968.1 AraC family transcriptional regulator [Massilibacteroides sp.]MDD4659888.1 AraC family transcriptional regulator [Massilibacteroides sp.]
MENYNIYTGHNVFKYLSINKNEVDSYMSISGVGYQIDTPGEEYPIKGHPVGYTFDPKRGRIIDDFAIVYITKGQGTFNSVITGEKSIKQGNAFFIFPGQWHTYHPDKKTGWDEYWVTFKGSYFNALFNSIINKKDPIYYVGMNEQVVKLFHEMLICAQSEQIGFQQILSGITLHIFGLFYSINKNRIFETQDTQRIKEACVIMRENIFNKVSSADIASSLNMSYSSFRKLFKQYIGVAPHQYMLQLKIEKIKDLLGSTDLSIQEIANSLNFESADYFSFFFRSKTGVNPLLFRQNIERQSSEANLNIQTE